MNSKLHHVQVEDSRPLHIFFYVGTNLLVEECPRTPIEMENIYVPYDIVLGSLMYA